MAVEIPVVIDIEGAFKDAAAKVNKAITPLQDYMDANALQIRLNIGDHTKISVGEILNDATISAKQLEVAIADIEKKIARLSAKGGFDLTSELKYSEKIILQAYSALENKAHGAADASKAMAKVYESNLQRIQGKVTKLTAKLDDLTRKQNKTAVRLNADKEIERIEPAYSRLGKQIDKTKVQLDSAKQSLKYVTFELEKIRNAGNAAAVAVGEISGPAATLAAQWRRGEEYVNRWNAALGSANSRLGTLIKGSISLVALHSARTFVRNIREVTAEFEMQRVALGGIIQDTEMAEKLFRQIKAAAIQSPFEIKDLVTYTKQLSAYQIRTEDLFKTTMKLADVSAGLGVDMNRLILAYGQVRAASVLRGQELRQFTEAGIPLVEKLAEKFRELGREGTTTADVFELISQRAVPFRMIAEIFDDMTSAGGEFYRMQEVQSETLKGQWMKLKDALSIMYDEIGNTSVVHKAMEDLLSGAMKLMQNWRETSRAISAVVAAMVAYKIAIVNAKIAAAALTATEMAEVSALSLNVVGRSRLIAAIFGEAAATKAQLALGNLYVQVKTKEMLATNLFTKSLWKMTAAFLANPYAVAIAGITALTIGLIRLTTKTKEATISYDDLQKSMGAFDRASTHTKQLEDMADAYDALIAKVGKSEEDQKKLDRITKELAKTFPQAVSGINEETNALEINIGKVRELTGAEKELAEARMRRDAKRAQNRIEQLEKEQQKILSQKEQGGENVILPAGGVVFRKWTDEDLAQMSIKLQDVNKELSDMRDLVGQVEDALGGTEKNSPATTDNTLVAWKDKLSKIQEEKKAAGMTQIFSPDEIQQLGTVNDLWKKTKKGIEDSEKALAAFKALSLTLTDEDAIKANDKSIAQTEKQLEFWKEVQKTFGFVFKKDTGGRDTRLSQLRSEISELTNAYKKFQELQKYKSKDEALIDINTLFPQLKGAVPNLDYVVQELEKKLAKVKADLKKSPNSKTLLDMQRALETEISNLKFDKLKDDLKNKLDRLKNDLKRSETARKFYEDILDLTGDETVASTLQVQIYGDISKDFKERLQQQMTEALGSLKLIRGKDVGSDVEEAFANLDFENILKMADLPEEVRKVVEEAYEAMQKHNADWVLDLMKTYQKTKTYEERITDIQKREAKKREEIASRSTLSPEQKQTYTEASKKKEAEDIAKVQLESLKDTYAWTKAFENLEGVSTRTLEDLVDLIDEYITKYAKDLEPQQLKELTRSKEQVEAQLAARNSWKALSKSMTSYINAVKARRKIEEESGKDSKEYAKGLDAERKAILELETSISTIKQEFDTAASAAKDLMQVFASSDDAQHFSEQMDNASKALSGIGNATVGIAKLATGDITPQSILQTVSGLAEIVTGVANFAAAAQMKKWTKEMTIQEKLVEKLEYDYNHLSHAIERAFGGDYLYDYSRQMDILIAKQEAYNKQLAIQEEVSKKASRQSDKDAAIEAAEEIRKSLDEVATAIQELQESASEKFLGTTLTSAAEEFATSWLDAYREFGSTTDAIQDKMEDMINNLIIKSTMAEAAKRILEPFFDEVERLSKDNELDPSDITYLTNMLQGKMTQIDTSMTSWMQIFQSLGMNLRSQTGNFSGIARNIATASEESILGLSAGINTQNYYMSYVPAISADLQQILALMGGAPMSAAPTVATTSAEEGPIMPSVQEMIYDHLPNIDRNISEMLRLMNNVIKPNGTSAPYYVATKM